MVKLKKVSLNMMQSLLLSRVLLRTNKFIFVCTFCCAFVLNTSAQDWAWLEGTPTMSVEAQSVYPTRPGARKGAASWRDSQGNLWLFGGQDYLLSDLRNDLWKYNPTTDKWIWMKGTNATNQGGVYGTLGVSAATNRPGARSNSVGWTDANGKFWLFGGNGVNGYYNDLWNYDPSTNNWTWISGDNTASSNIYGVYGTMGVAAPANKPGHRGNSCGWIDNLGNLWLFGGYGYAASSGGLLSDLWKFDPSTGLWAWMNGSPSSNQVPSYGTLNTPQPSNTPGGRTDATAWTDASGNLLLFGGALSSTWANDVWKYDPSSNTWSWINGSNLANQISFYGTMGVPSASTTPGARFSAASWTDANNDLWLFGGVGADSLSTTIWLADLWKYNSTANNWTWVKGLTSANKVGIYNGLGVSSFASNPGCRSEGMMWGDSQGKIYMFGGKGNASTPALCAMNDLWRYTINTNTWSWINGSFIGDQLGVYGTQGTANIPYPSSRSRATLWTKSNGEIWLFAGNGPTNSPINDLWKYDPSTQEWTWVRGLPNLYTAAVTGTLGVPDVNISPVGANGAQAGWLDSQERLWIYAVDDPNTSQGGGVWVYDTQTNKWTQKTASSSGPVFGTQGISNANNNPGKRNWTIVFKGISGEVWLFGGGIINGFSITNDLWKYDMANNLWTWMKGSSTTGPQGIYNTLGVGAPQNTPGGRINACGWMDPAGKLWIFGGFGVDSQPQQFNNQGAGLNDLWKYDPVTNNWTWMNGSSGNSSPSTYGVQGISTSSTKPGARRFSMSWCDNNTGNLYLFGGMDQSINYGATLNDFWVYSQNSNQWTWVKGSTMPYQTGTYGTQGQPAPANIPGSRYEASTTKSANGRFILFGGLGYSATSGPLGLNDLWLDNNCFAPLPPVVSTSSTSPNVCIGQSATLTASANGPINWYSSPTSSIALGNGTTFITPPLTATSQNFYAEAIGTCTVNSLRDTVTVMANSLPQVSITAVTQTVCNGNAFTLYASGSAQTYTWNGGSNLNSYTSTLSATTVYSLAGTSPNGCVNSTSITMYTTICTGLFSHNNEGSEFLMYPNPTQTNLVIKSSNENEHLQIKITNTIGELLFTERATGKTTVDVSHLVPAVYFVEIATKTSTVVKKLILH